MTTIMPPTEEAEWRPLYRHCQALDYDATLTYEEIAGILGFDVRVKGRWAVLRTDQELQAYAQRTLVNVRRIGYRIALPSEHETLMYRRQRRSRKQLHKARRTGEATNLNLIDATARRRIADMVTHVSALEDRLRYEARKNQTKFAELDARVETLGEHVSSHTASFEERLASLEGRLRGDQQ